MKFPILLTLSSILLYAADPPRITPTGGFAPAHGTALPANCTVGEIFIKTNAAAGANSYVALATGTPCTWTQQTGNGLVDPGANGVLKRTSANTTTTVTGNPSDCIHVDGTSGTCGTGGGGGSGTTWSGMTANSWSELR